MEDVGLQNLHMGLLGIFCSFGGMKRKSIVLFSLLMLEIFGFAQDAKDILKASFLKCNEVTSGNYVMLYQWKVMTQKDTIRDTIITDFVKVANDFIMPIKFRLFNCRYKLGTWYDGKEYISFDGKDSTASVAKTKKFEKYIQSIKHNNRFFDAMVRPESFNAFKFSDSGRVYSFLGMENIGIARYYKIKIS